MVYDNGIMLEDLHHKQINFKSLLNKQSFIIWK